MLGFQRLWLDLFPDGRQVVVPASNHFPVDDDPDLLADSIRDSWRV